MPVYKLTDKNCTQTKHRNTPVNYMQHSLRMNGSLMSENLHSLKDIEVYSEKDKDY